MKVIDILNKIANEEELPNEFKWRAVTFVQTGDKNYYIASDSNCYMFELMCTEDINDEIEVIENKKIEKIFTGGYDTISDTTLAKKINEIIDVVNKLKEEERMKSDRNK